MADFYATYSPSAPSGAAVVASQGTTPWVVAGNGVAGTAATGVLSVQGIAGGTALPISGSITATNPSIGATGAAVPASGTYLAASIAGTLTGLVATAGGLKTDGSAVTQPVTGTGTAGTAAAGVVTVQGITSMTALKVDGTGGTFPVSGTVAVTQSTSPWVTSGGGTAGSAATGVVTVQGIASMTPLLVTESPSLTSSTFQDGAIAFGSLTTNYQTVVATGGVVKNVSVRNNTNGTIVVSFDGGSTTAITMDAGDQVSWDLDANHGRIPISTNLQAKYSGSAPTSGSIRINVFY